MRRTSVVAAAALIAALALAGLPAPAGSRTSSTDRAVELAAFSTLNIRAVNTQARDTSGVSGAAERPAGHLDADAQLVEPGTAPRVTATRPKVTQPPSASGSTLKPPKYTISGYATFYDNGTTAMRLPRGTVVRICGAGGCLERTVTDYGPIKPIRIVDMYRPDFFKVCGCASWSGTTWVTVSVY
jgi:hypothetical protein